MRCVLTDSAAADLERRYEHRRRLWLDGPYGGSVAYDKVMDLEVGLYIAYCFSDVPAFIRRARARGRLRHPHLLPVLDFGMTLDRLPYFTEPFVEARDLGSLLKTWEDRRPFPLRHLVRAVTGVCRAVAYCHARGLCHLDLTPGAVQVDDSLTDVFVTGGWEEAGFLSAGPEQGLASQIPTPGYAAPEQVRFSEGALARRGLWRQVDVYGLGGILHLILYDAPPNRVPPGAAASPVNLLQALLSGQGLDRRGQLRPALRAGTKAVSDLEQIAAKALELDPGVRSQAAEGMAAELEKWLAT
jgi:serine/threonine-protein kinase